MTLLVDASANPGRVPGPDPATDAGLALPPPERLVSQPIRPVDPGDALIAWTVGEPLLPKAFLWQQATIRLEQCLEKWKESAAAEGGERYVRKHWYRVRLADGRVAKLYCLRRPDHRRKAALRWRLFSLAEPHCGK